MYEARTSKQGYLYQWILLLFIIGAIVFVVTYRMQRSSRPVDGAADRIKAMATMKTFVTAVSVGDETSAGDMTFDPPAARPTIALLVGTAVLDDAMRQQFDLAYVNHPLPGELALDAARTKQDDGLFAFVGTNAFVRKNGGDWVVDVTLLADSAAVPLDKAQALAKELTALADRVRAGEFKTAADVESAAAGSAIIGLLKGMQSPPAE